jgi:hypothetical protein
VGNSRTEPFQHSLFVVALPVHGAITTADDSRDAILLLQDLHDQSHDWRLSGASCGDISHTDHRSVDSTRLANSPIKPSVSQADCSTINGLQNRKSKPADSSENAVRLSADQIEEDLFVQAEELDILSVSVGLFVGEY